MKVVSFDRPNSFPDVFAETGISSATGLPWRVMMTRDFFFCTLSITPWHLAFNCVIVMSIA
jgi:hypothetical protein